MTDDDDNNDNAREQNSLSAGRVLKQAWSDHGMIIGNGIDQARKRAGVRYEGLALAKALAAASEKCFGREHRANATRSGARFG
jgi:hypothetical protein